MKTAFKKFSAYSVIVSSILFIILTTIAMFLYPGGYSIEGVKVFVDRYYFNLNFFSDLGMLVTETFQYNYASALLFCVALSIEGIAFLLYAISLPSYFQKGTIQFRFAVVSAFFAVISAIGYIGVAFTPWDILLGPHVLFVFIAFPVSLGYSCFFFIPIFMTKKYPNIFGYMLIVFSIAMGVYLWFLFGGPNYSGFEGRVIAAVSPESNCIYNDCLNSTPRIRFPYCNQKKSI